MATLLKRNGIYYVKYYLNGRDTRRSLGVTNKDIAKKMFREFEEEMEKVKAGITDHAITPEQAFTSYMTVKETTIKPQVTIRYKQHWAAIEKFLAEKQLKYLNDLTGELVTQYVSWRRQTPKLISKRRSKTKPRRTISEKTIKEELRLLKSVTTWLVEERHLSSAPVFKFPKLKTVAKNPDTLGGYTKEDMEKILDYFKGQSIGPAFIFLRFTGTRRGEMAALKVKDIDLANKSIRVFSVKTATNTSDQYRIVEIHPQLLPVLEDAVRGKRPDELVFPQTREHRPAWMTQLLRKACSRLGIQYHCVHGIRHFWITSMLMSGAPSAIVMKMAGHSNLSTTQKYLHVGAENKGWIERI